MGTITISEEEFKKFHEQTVKLAAQEAVRKYASETSKESIRKREVREIRNKLNTYRIRKKTLEEEAEFSPEEKLEYRLSFIEDLMGVTRNPDRTENIILAREEKRKSVAYEIATIEHAINKFYEEVMSGFDEERKCWYRVMYDYYIKDPGDSIDAIAERENIATRSVWRYIDRACAVLLEYIV